MLFFACCRRQVPIFKFGGEAEASVSLCMERETREKGEGKGKEEN